MPCCGRPAGQAKTGGWMAQRRMLPAPVPSSTAARERLRTVRRRDTSAEVSLRSALHRLGLRYRVDVRPEAALPWRPDIVFPGRRIAVYVDGCFWHHCPSHGSRPTSNAGWWAEKLRYNVRRDRRATAELTAAGWTVVRVWEHEDPEVAAEGVAALVRSRANRRRERRRV